MTRSLQHIIKGKCPKCGNGNVFRSKGNIFLFRMPAMHSQCSHCRYTFEKEPGYFFGAMYVSYALGVAEMAGVFVISRILDIPMEYLLYLIIFTIIALTSFNFRISRIIWMHII